MDALACRRSAQRPRHAPATGSLRAEASLTPEQIHSIHTQDKGEVLVAVTVTDEAGIQPIECEILWAWVSKKRCCCNSA